MNNKTLLILLITLISLTFCACSTGENMFCNQGIYKYIADEIVIFEDVSFAEATLILTKVDKSQKDSCNVLRNPEKEEYYSVAWSFVIDGQVAECPLKVLYRCDKTGNQENKYDILLDISALFGSRDFCLKIVLEFDTPTFYSNDFDGATLVRVQFEEITSGDSVIKTFEPSEVIFPMILLDLV